MVIQDWYFHIYYTVCPKPYFLIILLVTQLLLTKSKVSKNRKYINVIKDSYTELNLILRICISARSLFEIYHGFSYDTSELIEDRVVYHKDHIENTIELLRNVHNSLQNLDFPYTDSHTNLINNPSELTIWEAGEQMDKNSIVSTSISFIVGITKFIARITDISGINSEVFRRGIDNADSSDKSIIARLEYYIILNGEGRLREIAELSANYYLEEAINNFMKDKILLYIFSSLGTICTVMILMFIIPYIMKVQKNILKVFDHISGIPQDEIKKILDMCYIFKDEIEAPIEKLKVIYDKEDFSMTTDELRKEERAKKKRLLKQKEKSKILSKLHKKAHKINSKHDEEEEEKKLKAKENDDINNNKQNNEDIEMKYLLIIEERKSEAKKKLFSQITNSKRRGYILRLAILLLFFAIFLITDVLLLKSYFEQGNDAFDILGLFTTREYVMLTAILFYRDDLKINDVFIFERNLLINEIGNNELLMEYMLHSFDKEKEILTITRHLEDNFPSMEDYLLTLESNNSCKEYADSVESINSSK